MKSARLVAVVLLLIRVCNAGAQPGTPADHWPYIVNHYTDENGLPQNSVKGIAMDRSGFVWLATESGLVRFDGQRFYSFNKSNTPLGSTRFYALLPDLEGNTDRFYALADDASYLRVESNIAASDPGYFKNTLARIPNMEERNSTTLLASGSPNYFFLEKRVLHYAVMLPNTVGSFYIVDKHKTAFFLHWKKRWEVPLEITEFARFFAHQGNLFYCNPEKGIVRVTERGEAAVTLKGAILTDPAYTRDGRNFKLYWNNISDQTFILLGKNFYFLDKRKGDAWDTKLMLSGFDFVANNIKTVHYEPSVKRLFLGSTTSGLYVFGKKQFRTLRSGYEDIKNVFYAQTAIDSNTVLTPDGVILGLKKSDRAGSIFADSLITSTSKLMQKASKFDSRSMLTSSSGQIWIKTFSMLHQFNRTRDKLLQSWDIGDEIKAIYEGKDGKIWVGTVQKGLFFIDKKQPGLQAFPGGKIPDITYIMQADYRYMWVATLRGLYRLDLKTGASDLIRGTERLNIRGIYISPAKPDAAFLTTYEDGVFLYTDKKLVRFPIDPNRHMAVAHCMVEDNRGFLWVPTNNGLFQISKKDLFNYARDAKPYVSTSDTVRADTKNLFYMYYAKDQGFYTNEFNGGCQPCAVRLPGGTVSLPSLNGLVWFDPETIDPDLPDKGLVIYELMIHGKTHQVLKDTIRLPLGAKQLEFHVSAPYYGNFNNLHLSYAIVPSGVNPEPSNWTALKPSDPIIRFSELDYGEYALFIRKVNGFGIENYTTKQLLVIVPRHWYETWWFRDILVLLLAGCIYMYILFRTRYLEKLNQELEIQIQKRTEKLSETLLALQTSEKELSRQMHIQTRLIASISHDIRTPLRFIIDSADKLEGFLETNDYSMIGRVGSAITSSGSKMARLLDNTIGYIRTQVYRRDIKFQNVLIQLVIKEKEDLFSPVMKEHNNRFINKVSKGEMVNATEQLLGIIIHNLIDNACKYTFDGTIMAETENRDGKLHLIISDTGPGIPKSFLDWLNKSGPEDSIQSMTNLEGKYNGLGLLIVKEIASLINTRIFVEYDHGTRFHLIFD